MIISNNSSGGRVAAYIRSNFIRESLTEDAQEFENIITENKKRVKNCRFSEISDILKEEKYRELVAQYDEKFVLYTT